MLFLCTFCLNIHTHLRVYIYVLVLVQSYCIWWFTLDLWTSGKFACWQVLVLILFLCTFCLNTHTHTHTLACIYIYVFILLQNYCTWWFTLDLWTSGKFACWQVNWLMLFFAPFVSTHTHTHLHSIYVYVFFLVKSYCTWWFTLWSLNFR
jgi:hypothetical protein